MKFNPPATVGQDRMRVALVGPMRGITDFNYPAFYAVENAWLREHPNDVVLNPASNHDGRTDLALSVYLQKSLEQVLSAQMIVLLPGWEASEGASQYEVPAARVTGKLFYEAHYNSGVSPGRWEFRDVPAPPLAALQHDFKAEQLALLATHRGLNAVRKFESGATRDTENGKLDYEAYLSPAVLTRYAEYMHKHRIQSDGTLRPGDNWQKGIPLDVYMKSMWRHFMEVWRMHRQQDGYADADMRDALCGVLFNAFGYLFEVDK